MTESDFERRIVLLTEAVSRIAAGVANEIGTAEVQGNRMLAVARGLATADYERREGDTRTSDRIDELVASADPHMKWLCQRLNVQGTGYEGGPDDRALREVKKAMSQLATIAREAEATCEWLVDITASHAVAANLLREDETRDEYKARLLKAASEAM